MQDYTNIVLNWGMTYANCPEQLYITLNIISYYRHNTRLHYPLYILIAG